MAITGINNTINVSNTMSLQQPSTLQGSVRLINQSKNMISQIDEKINCVENKIAKNDHVIKVSKEMIVAIDESIRLNKDYIQTLKESKQIDREIINIHERTINRLQALIDRKWDKKIDVSDVKLLDSQLDTLSKKDNVLKAQAATVDTKIEKLAVKVDFVEKQITKLEAKSDSVDDSNVQVKPNKNSFATSYRPTTDQIAKLELSKIQLETVVPDTSTSLFQQRVFYSQKNIYESILNSLLLKVVV